MTDHDNEAAHGLQASAAKQRIDEQTKPVPPAVCEYAVQQLAALKAQPSAVDERSAFEAHMRVGGYSNPDKHPDGSYVSSAMELWWQGWKARAALSAPSRGEQVREVPTQWWLATLDQYGNPTLTDGMHSDRAGANRAFYLHGAFGFTEGERYAVAKVELFEPVADDSGVNHEAVETVQAAMAAAPSAGSQEQE